METREGNLKKWVVSLVLIQFFNAYNSGSERMSILNRPFANRWLNLAVVWELVLLAAILYVLLLQGLGTFALGPLRLAPRATGGIDDRSRARMREVVRAAWLLRRTQITHVGQCRMNDPFQQARAVRKM